uniref:Retrotransposon Copia-like N-terminal domain-containing protein n=1 Tax=Ananas comosus var. bracteatus TaxID=296719 RepID=A0A6V7PUX5_ANACO|nr:unnamed protein product [Ananas comosus var. bracteatus]
MSENKSENETPETSIDDSDPLVLHHSDHPGMMLVSKPLEGYNYGQWSRAMRISLSAKNKIGFVDGSIKVHALVLQQERQADVAAKRETSVGHHAMQYSSLPQANRPPVLSESGTPKRLLKCRYCDREGHLIDHCFYLHGFPVGHKLHGKNVKPKGKRHVAHNTQNNDVESLKVPTTATATFTTEEYNQLMALLRKGNGNEQSFANVTGRGYEEEDWPGQAI